ncbi:integrase, catalytic region, zinc finger, CCHC-type containing protein [Tanacetum coccineum]|uniref:Integrase, catalytic region, zinc finger, CCHC-type containing protein n=1 Tax=Tanacetum coccineum TaxID=301880 RepID=A0ABQ5I0R1_9ASTR
MDEYHEVHEMQNDVQHNYVVDSNAEYMSDSNIIPYNQYLEDNKENGGVQSRLANKPDKVVNDSLTSELVRYKELVGDCPPDYSKENLLATFAPQRNLTPEQIFWSIDENDRKKAETSVPKPLSALTVYPPNTPVKLVPRVLPTKSQVKINLYVLTQLFTEFDKTCKKRITPTGVTEGERGFEQTKRCYLTEVIPFFKTLKEHFAGVQTALFKEVKVMEEIFDQMNDEVDQNTVDKQCAEIVKKNLLIENENLIANCLSNQLLYDVEKSRCLDLEAEMSKVHNESNHISKLEREYLNLQLKYQHLQESFDNNKSQTSQEAPDFNSFFKIKNLEHQIQEKDNVIRDLKVLVSNVNDRSCEPYNDKDVTDLLEQNESLRAEIEKVKQHYKEMFESIKITRTSTNENTSSLLTQIEDLKAQLEGNLKVATRSSVKPKVLAPGMYAIDVKPIPHPLKNNRSAHLTYINHLKESVETVREIVEEARVVKPLDNALNYACQYTKLSQELLEYVIGTCPKSFNERDNKAPSTPVTRKKQVTFSDKPGTSSSDTQKHDVHQKVQQTNIPVIPSTGVNTSTEASGSKPRSNTKKNRILPAKRENKKKVEDHLRTNKSVWTKVNRVDSSISYRRVVINSNSESVCKMCNKCLNSANHEMCVVNILSSVNATPTVKKVLNKGKQIWKPKGKLSDNRLNMTKRVWKATGKLFADIGCQWRPTGKKFTLGKLDCGYQWRPTGKKFALGEMCPLTKLSVKCCSKHMTGNRSKLKNFVEKFIGTVRFGNDHFGAIMGYGDYVIGDSVISRVYYVEGLGHNLFSVGQFCDSDLEVAFRKHTCFVRDINGADILKGSRSTNLYTISIDDMMKSSPICLLSKASKSKSWLWHRRLNHLNFGTINDLARKDLVRGLPRLKTHIFPIFPTAALTLLCPAITSNVVEGNASFTFAFRAAVLTVLAVIIDVIVLGELLLRTKRLVSTKTGSDSSSTDKGTAIRQPKCNVLNDYSILQMIMQELRKYSKPRADIADFRWTAVTGLSSRDPASRSSLRVLQSSTRCAIWHIRPSIKELHKNPRHRRTPAIRCDDVLQSSHQARYYWWRDRGLNGRGNAPCTGMLIQRNPNQTLIANHANPTQKDAYTKDHDSGIISCAQWASSVPESSAAEKTF